MKHSCLKLCLITHLPTESFSTYQSLMRKAIAGGITSVQLREKHATSNELYLLADKLKHFLESYHIPLIINDHVDIAKKVDAAGVHLGASDQLPTEARKKLGPRKIIGLSVETLTELGTANQNSDIDYIAASAVFPSTTKTDCKTIWGIQGLKNLTKISKHPVIAVGGININNIQAVMRSGAFGVAVISAIQGHPQPEIAAQTLIQIINQPFQGRKYV